MYATVYTKGSTDVVRGIPCDMLQCLVTDVSSYLADGYVTDPKELIPKKREAKKAAKPQADLKVSAKEDEPN